MLAAGLGVVERGRSTYTTGQVPPAYLRRLDR